MEDKPKNQKIPKGSIRDKKTSPIPWHHSRWFWGVVMAPILIIGFIFLVGTMLGIGKMSPGNVFRPSVFLSFLTYGFILGISIIIPFEIPAYSFYTKTIYSTLSHLLTVIYCLIMLFFFYQTIKGKRVEIKYPIILLIIFIISIFGFMTLFIVS